MLPIKNQPTQNQPTQNNIETDNTEDICTICMKKYLKPTATGRNKEVAIFSHNAINMNNGTEVRHRFHFNCILELIKKMLEENNHRTFFKCPNCSQEIKLTELNGYVNFPLSYAIKENDTFCIEKSLEHYIDVDDFKKSVQCAIDRKDKNLLIKLFSKSEKNKELKSCVTSITEEYIKINNKEITSMIFEILPKKIVIKLIKKIANEKKTKYPNDVKKSIITYIAKSSPDFLDKYNLKKLMGKIKSINKKQIVAEAFIESKNIPEILTYLLKNQIIKNNYHLTLDKLVNPFKFSEPLNNEIPNTPKFGGQSNLNPHKLMNEQQTLKKQEPTQPNLQQTVKKNKTQPNLQQTLKKQEPPQLNFKKTVKPTTKQLIVKNQEETPFQQPYSAKKPSWK